MQKKVSIRLKSFLRSLRNRYLGKAIPFLPFINQKVYDCFLFNNELDILRLRLTELYSHVDYFVICECGVTFSGEKKPLFYSLNKDKFLEFQDKILHFIIPDPPAYAYVENPINPEKKISQFWQRNQMALAIQSTAKNDLILISDADEIPRPSRIPYIAKYCFYSRSVVYLSQLWYLLFLNVRVNHRQNVVFASNLQAPNKRNSEWLGTFACTADVLKRRFQGDLNRIWSMKWGDHCLSYTIVEYAGWHLSYMGGMEGLLTKIQSNGMTPYTYRHVNDLYQGKFLDCDLKVESIGEHHPKELLVNPKLWSHLMLHQNSLMDLASELENFIAQQL